VRGLDTLPTPETIFLYVSPTFVKATMVPGTLNQFTLTGMESGPDHTQCEVSVQRSHGAGGIVFFVDVYPAPIVPVDGLGLPTGANP
jgi:hypothetical protein